MSRHIIGLLDGDMVIKYAVGDADTLTEFYYQHPGGWFVDSLAGECPRCGEPALLLGDGERHPSWLVKDGGVVCLDCEYEGICPCGSELVDADEGYCSVSCKQEAEH